MRNDDLSILNEFSLDRIEQDLDYHTTRPIPVDRYTRFTWSVSRHHMYNRCQREYYLNYYGSRNVRGAASRVVSAVWWLKQITSLPAWIGTVIHHVAADALNAYLDGITRSPDDLKMQADSYYWDGVAASARGSKHDNRWMILPNQVYRDDLSKAEIEQGGARVAELVDTMVTSDAYQWLLSIPPEQIAELDVPFQSFDYTPPGTRQTIPVFAIPDVLVAQDDLITIIDWKTGSVDGEEYGLQAGVYRLYAASEYDEPEDHIIVRLADLGGDGALVEPAGGVPALDEANAFIAGSITAMIEQMNDSKYNTVSVHNAPMTGDLALCARCRFRMVCKR